MNPATSLASETAGAFTTLDGETYYRIAAFDRLPPFLISLASDSDLWFFIASGGGLTAGRRDPDGALFPYETVDRLHDGHHHTGPITLLRVVGPGGDEVLWEPFREDGGRPGDPPVERNLYKNVAGNRLVFEETHHGLGLRFRYRWTGSDEFGLVRTATLENLGARTRSVALLDGLRNLLPHGAPLALYQHSSCLVDAYKRADCDPATGFATYSLTSRITDRAEALEELRATTVWCRGLPSFRVSLSLDAAAAFRRGEPPAAESISTGRRGHYLVSASIEVEAGAARSWHIVADVGRSHVEAAALRARLLEDAGLDARIERSLAAATENLRRLVAGADGLQVGGRPEATAHHFANVLFNCMRGGVFVRDYEVSLADFASFLGVRNREALRRFQDRRGGLPAAIAAPDLVRALDRWNDPDLLRLGYEYLPLHFGRRHGDPSRPWNRFSIRVKNADGSRALHYEGNWRDIFQNWEALGASFPEFLPHLVAKFVNASTADGFNPYRITRDGIDWEVPDPGTPWGHIGYWGDHQIVYLLRLLEAADRTAPSALADLLDRAIFSYADVPYRLKPYERILEDPRHTIEYDHERAARIESRVALLGTDGRLLPAPDGTVHHATLLEKLLVPALSKMSNFVPGGGIWMNTQRPEWNDANNALPGYGLSMVTLFHLRRYLRFLEALLERSARPAAPLSAAVATWLRRVSAALEDARPRVESGASDPAERKRLLDALGAAFSEYRDVVSARGLAGETSAVPAAEAAAFCRVALLHLDRTIREARRGDGLYHSYNVLELSSGGRAAAVQPLDEMLEGQVAALSSGVVGASEAAGLVASLFESRLYRADQRSFLLYPNRDLPSFLERNRVPEPEALAVPLLRDMLEAGDPRIVERDALGVLRFHPDLREAADLAAALDDLARDDRWKERAIRGRKGALDLYESVFHHRAFTGRSGRMYAYEGLGAVYWHMVGKLLLAVQEVALRAEREGAPEADRRALVEAYFRVRAGLGFEKSVSEYGAFPTDPYSHTPAHAGAQQPGMTGQVKEAILARFGELGVVVELGLLAFRPRLLRREEFLRERGEFRFYDAEGRAGSIEVPEGSLAFSYGRVPVVYSRIAGEPWIRVEGADGTAATFAGDRLDAGTSRAVFRRAGTVARVEVGVPDRLLLP
ncbi:MAG TPA: hypothetical protein VFT32_08425 [Candidatus Eisenbacteria bacterium]|nr:hypothetical protein [Candidatus Eisenbacteria bacterium]